MAKQTMVSAAVSTIPTDDAPLVEQARAGDMNALSRLVLKYQDRVLNTCYRICGSLEEAQDLTQETFLHAMQSIGSFQGRARFYTWLFRIAVNLSLTHRRQRARAPKLALTTHDGEWLPDQQPAQLSARGGRESSDPAARLISRESQEIVLDALDRLDDDARTVIVLRDLESLDYQEISLVLEVPVGTVKSRLHRARLELRTRLKSLIGP